MMYQVTDGLSQLLLLLKHEEPIEYVFIEYYLPGQDRNSFNYGISKRTPKQHSTELSCVGSPKDTDNSDDSPYKGGKVFGAWELGISRVIFYEKNNNCYKVEYDYHDNKYRTPKRYNKTKFRGLTAFKNAEKTDDSLMFVISKNGDLTTYLDGERLATFSPTQY